MLPNFLLVGAMKCGTTSLAAQMATHPEIFIPSRKELHFFSRDERWNKGVSWYESFFREAGTAKAIGEGSTTYTMFPTVKNVPARIAEALPDVRLLYIVRHPVDRVVSHYMHRWYGGGTDAEFEKVLEDQPEVLAYSRYYYQIEQFLPYFPPERWHVIVLEEFAEDPLGTHKKIYEFLEIDAGFEPADLAPKLTMAGRVRESRFVATVRRIPLIRRIGRLILPARVQKRLRQLGGSKRAKPQMPDKLYNTLIEELLADVGALSDFAHRDFTKTWDLRRR